MSLYFYNQIQQDQNYDHRTVPDGIDQTDHQSILESSKVQKI